MLRAMVSVVLLVLALGGCAESDVPPGGSGAGSSQSPDSEIDLRFAYFGVADTGMLDQTVTITNPSTDFSATPTLSFQALDANSNPLIGVSVTTVFGSDKGLVVAPANYEVFDILRFEGADAGDVKDVKVTIEKMLTVEDSGTTYPEVDYLDAQGHSVEYPYEAHTVRVSNPGASDYVVRLVGITWNRPLEGRSQQALTVSAVGDPVRVAARNDADVNLTPEAVAKYDSLKAYISIE